LLKIQDRQEGQISWIEFLHRAIRLAFPEFSFKKTKCNLMEFREILWNEIITPLLNFESVHQAEVWRLRNGDRVMHLMADRMFQLMKSRV